jgi:hypothetical protein
LAAQLRGQLEKPRLRWKYAWMEPIFGFEAAKRVQTTLPEFKASLVRKWDKAMCRIENPEAVGHATVTNPARGNSNGAI